MKKVYLFSLVILATIWACGGSDATGGDASSSSSSSRAEASIDGKALYKQNCVTCHGLYGDMGASGAANLQQSILPVEERIAVVTNGRGAMTAFKAILDEEEIAAVSAYTMELSE